MKISIPERLTATLLLLLLLLLHGSASREVWVGFGCTYAADAGLTLCLLQQLSLLSSQLLVVLWRLPVAPSHCAAHVAGRHPPWPRP
jgi:hypothetical protein